MYSESAFCVVNQTEVLASLLDRDHVHIAGWVRGVGADLAIDLNETLHDDSFGFAAIESIFETRYIVYRSVTTLAEESFGTIYRFRMKTISGMQSRNL